MILPIDNYDSFVHNPPATSGGWDRKRSSCNDEITATDLLRQNPPPSYSPGPCTPREAGNSLAIVRELAGKLPMLGVCLGHQTIGAAFGANIVRAPQPMHGRTSLIEHSGTGIFAGLPSRLTVGRYHSLVVEESTLPGN
jgi:anthranilate synthase/aminodeoxychorismate synthase-like glutamine amidotransferase